MINNNYLTLIAFLCMYSFLFFSISVLKFLSGLCIESFCKKVRLIYKRFIIKKRYVQFLVKHSSFKDLFLEMLFYPLDFLFWFLKFQVVLRIVHFFSFVLENSAIYAKRGATWVDHFLPEPIELEGEEDAFLLAKLKAGTLTVKYLDSLDFSDYSPEFAEKWEGAGITNKNLPAYELQHPRYFFLIPFFLIYTQLNYKYYVEIEHLTEYRDFWQEWWGFYEPIMQEYLSVRYYEPDNDNQIEWNKLTEYASIGVLIVFFHIAVICVWLSSPSMRSSFYNSRFYSQGLGLVYAITLLTVVHCFLWSEALHCYGYDWKFVEVHLFTPFINSIGHWLGYEEPIWVVKRWDQVPIETDLVMFILYDPIPRTIYPDYGPDYGSALAPGYPGFTANDQESGLTFPRFIGMTWVKEYFGIWGNWPEERNHNFSTEWSYEMNYYCTQLNAAYGDNKSIYTFYGCNSEYTVLVKEFWEFEYAYTKDWEFHWRKSWRFMPWEDPVW